MDEARGEERLPAAASARRVSLSLNLEIVDLEMWTSLLSSFFSFSSLTFFLLLYFYSAYNSETDISVSQFIKTGES